MSGCVFRVGGRVGVVCRFAAVLAAAVAGLCTAACAQGQTTNLAPTDRHVPELARYLSHLQLSEPVVYRGLAVYSLQLLDDNTLRGGWLTLDQATSRGVLKVTEKGSGASVPVVEAENTSREEHIFLMAGEMLSGGKQTRAIRDDVVLAPGQRVTLSVFCVEQHRWQGGSAFGSAGQIVPQSIGRELRRGVDQASIWSEVARNNAALGADNDTGSLELALKSKGVADQLTEVRRGIEPEIPRGTVGYLFVCHGRAVGAELFGREDIARAMLPKLLDSHAVDFVIQSGKIAPPHDGEHGAAVAFYNRMRRVGSHHAPTTGSGSGIRTRADGLLGDGVSLMETVVHYGIQVAERVFPAPKPIIRVPSRRDDS
ncbi:MAG: hypothetical protein FJ276_10965 [Planctomycetes bacterium]|nr:hypothetical protein [Planctomycetota bacterium]